MLRVARRLKMGRIPGIARMPWTARHLRMCRIPRIARRAGLLGGVGSLGWADRAGSLRMAHLWHIMSNVNLLSANSFPASPA